MKSPSISIDKELRETGIKSVKKAPWGTHLCQFYNTKKDLLSVLVPYFKAGLKNNEFCMWVTSEALTIDECKLAMEKAMPGFSKYLTRGQIEILDYKDWYLKDGNFDSQRVLNGWIDKLNKALAKGFEGLRLTGNTFWVEKKDWKAFSDYEKEVNGCIDKYNIIAVCTYSLAKCSVFEILEVVSNHQFTLIKHNNEWEVIEGSGNKETREKIKWLASFPEMNPNPVIETDLSGKIYYLNPAAEKLFPGLESLGDSHAYLSGLNSLLDKFEKGRRKDLAREIEVSNHWYHQTFHSIPHAKRVRIYGLEITEMRRMEEEMIRSEKKLLETIRVTGAGYYEHAVDYSVGFISNGFARILGFKHKELPEYPEFAKWFAQRIHKEDLEEFSEAVNAFYEKKTPRFDQEYRILAKNDKWVWLHTITTPLQKDLRRFPVYVGGLVFDVTKRRSMEEALIESEERLNKTQEIAHLGTWGHDFIKNKTYWSNETYRMYGYKPGKVIPSHVTFSNIVHPDDRKRVAATYFDSLKAGENGYTHVFRIINKSTNELRFIYEKCEHIKNSDGKTVNSIGMVQDITEQKHTEEALHESEEKFRAVAETAKDAIVSANSRGNIIYFNKGAEQIFGYIASEVFGKPLTILMPEKLREAHRHGFSRFLETKHPHAIGKTVEMLGKKKDGKEFPLELSLANWKVNNESFFTAIIRDITKRKQAEFDLEKFKLAVDNAEEHIVIANPEGNILYANDSVTRITGYPKKEIIGNKPSLWGKQMPLAFYENFWQTVKTEKKHFSGELINKRKNGQLYDAEIMVSQVFDENKNIKFFIGIERDITERKNLDQRKDDFITIAGHELRTPVSAIKIMNQILQEQLAGNPQALKYLKKIEQQANIQANLIDDLLNVSKIQTGKLEIRKEQFELHDLVEETIEDMQKTTKTHQILTRGKICGKILADKDRIRQVLVNFCSNAIKFSPKGGKIIVGLKCNHKEAVVGITDYGIGIPKEHHDRIFERFYRVYGSGNKAYPGLGMGLYISYQIIKLHNGKMWFESEHKKGSTFYFSIPFQT